MTALAASLLVVLLGGLLMWAAYMAGKAVAIIEGLAETLGNVAARPLREPASSPNPPESAP